MDNQIEKPHYLNLKRAHRVKLGIIEVSNYEVSDAYGLFGLFIRLIYIMMPQIAEKHANCSYTHGFMQGVMPLINMVQFMILSLWPFLVQVFDKTVKGSKSTNMNILPK